MSPKRRECLPSPAAPNLSTAVDSPILHIACNCHNFQGAQALGLPGLWFRNNQSPVTIKTSVLFPSTDPLSCHLIYHAVLDALAAGPSPFGLTSPNARMWEGFDFGPTARQECPVESDPGSLNIVPSFWVHNGDDRINNYHHQSVGISLLMIHLQNVKNNRALTLVSPVPYLPAPAHGDPERHDTALRALHQAERREAPLPVSARAGVGLPPLGWSQAGQAWPLHVSVQVQVEETEAQSWGGGFCSRLIS